MRCQPCAGLARVEEEEVCLLAAPGLGGGEGDRLNREQEKQRLGFAACESRSLGGLQPQDSQPLPMVSPAAPRYMSVRPACYILQIMRLWGERDSSGAVAVDTDRKKTTRV